ncbi:Glucose/ribitol dehydrogenase, partial [Cynara cardunculus var. scolymus]
YITIDRYYLYPDLIILILVLIRFRIKFKQQSKGLIRIMTWLFSLFNGASGFSGNSKAEEVTNGIDGTGLTAIVTGATSGIGLETARVLALRGVHVVMSVRNVKAGKEVKESICEKIPNAKLDVMELDLSSQESVRQFAADYISKDLPLHILMYENNFLPSSFTIFVEEGANVTVNSLHPGVIKTNLQRNQGFVASTISRVIYTFMKNIPQGAATSCYVALHPQVKGVSGEYFADSNIAKASKYALSPEMAKKLWDFSLNLTKLK